MYGYSPIWKIPLQEFTNWNCQLTRYFQQKMNDLFQGFEFICVYILNTAIVGSEYGPYQLFLHCVICPKQV